MRPIPYKSTNPLVITVKKHGLHSRIMINGPNFKCWVPQTKLKRKITAVVVGLGMGTGYTTKNDWIRNQRSKDEDKNRKRNGII